MIPELHKTYSVFQSSTKVFEGKVTKITPYSKRGNFIMVENAQYPGGYWCGFECDAVFYDPKDEPKEPMKTYADYAKEPCPLDSKYRGYS